jgi:hypothetical protein
MFCSDMKSRIHMKMVHLCSFIADKYEACFCNLNERCKSGRSKFFGKNIIIMYVVFPQL